MAARKIVEVPVAEGQKAEGRKEKKKNRPGSRSRQSGWADFVLRSFHSKGPAERLCAKNGSRWKCDDRGINGGKEDIHDRLERSQERRRFEVSIELITVTTTKAKIATNIA